MLRARDVERLENTSFATLLGGLPGGIVVAGAEGETCTCDCRTCTCCLPDYDESDLCCSLPYVGGPQGEAAGPCDDQRTAIIKIRGEDRTWEP